MFTPPASAAVDWWLVGLSEQSQHAVFIDSASITYDGNSRTFWVQTIYSPRGAADRKIERSFGRWEARCEQRSSRLLEGVFHHTNGRIERVADEKPAFEVVVPGSIAQSQLAFACEDPAARTEEPFGPRPIADPDAYVLEKFGR
jgi:hypothetical protein